MAVKCTCIEKFRDKQGRIKGYRLQDQQGKCIDVTPDNLKMAIFGKQFNVVNLQLTSDGRLIDKAAQQLAPVQNEFEQLLGLLQYYYDPKENRKISGVDYNSKSIPEEAEVKAIKLLKGLGVNIKKLDKPDNLDVFYKYCVGKTLINFNTFSGIYLKNAEDIEIFDGWENDAIWDSVNSKKNLRRLIKYFKSDANMNSIHYYDVYKHTLSVLRAIINKYDLAKDYTVAVTDAEKDGFTGDSLYMFICPKILSFEKKVPLCFQIEMLGGKKNIIKVSTYMGYIGDSFYEYEHAGEPSFTEFFGNKNEYKNELFEYIRKIGELALKRNLESLTNQQTIHQTEEIDKGPKTTRILFN